MPQLLVILLLILALPGPAAAAGTDDFFTNIPAQQAPTWRPGMLVVLPDRQQAIIEERLPDGRLRTDLGVILTPDGIVAEGPHQGQAAILVAPEQGQQPAAEMPGLPLEPAGTEETPGTMVIAPEKSVTPDGITPEQEHAELPNPAVPAQPQLTPEVSVAPPARQDQYLSLAELLPMTEVPEKTAVPEARKEEKAKQPPRAEAKAPAKPVKPEPEKKQPPQAEKKEKKPEPPQKSKPGQAMRIPSEAAQTGNLDFLEGCWQGTRPEYYSKRTIRECFCFGPGGSNGKRRVFDPLGRRQCIGSTRAKLSKSGVLSVTSSGAVCNDGERWGQAEMVCRNSGPKTPCTWVFHDANNASQSYEIPFVRVESCGR